MTEAEWAVELDEDAQVRITVADDDETVTYTLEPVLAAALAAKIFDVVEESQ